ncbi:MAG: hypothetical protein KBA61_07710 [Spirochaetes bacterium]|nr:hypothetical protein [Spirochaetota bacterium]
MLRTTIHMKKTIYRKIDIAASQLQVSKREIIIILLSQIQRDIKHFPKGFTLVKYQPRDPLKQWHCFTIVFKKQENELVSDFRRLGKFSVSYFIAIATERYLDQLLLDGEIMHKNVKLDQYAIGQSIVNGIICWEYYWGDPGDSPRNRTCVKIFLRMGNG